MSWNKIAAQNVCLSEVGETVAQIWPQVVEIALFQELHKNVRILIAPVAPMFYGSHSLKFSYF
jgi:hypothetical protein